MGFLIYLFFFGINLQAAPLYVKYPAFLIFIMINNLIVFAYTWRQVWRKAEKRYDEMYQKGWDEGAAEAAAQLQFPNPEDPPS